MSKILFASDFHLGQKGLTSSQERERALIRWMNEVATQADEIFFIGDVFDFWYEYKTVIPKGFSRFIGTMGNLVDQGKKINLFTGNHDMWIFDYFTNEFGIPLYRQPIIIERQGKKILIGHGDGLGPGDYMYKFIKKIFNNGLCIKLFHWIHPSIGMYIANAWSTSSRMGHKDIYNFYGEDKEILLRYCEDQLIENKDIDFMIFGHRHLPINYLLSNNHTRYINTGDWLAFQSYATMVNGEMNVQFFERNHFKVITNDPSTWNFNLGQMGNQIPYL
ncbi:MAG: UDP-2,3-diacylglucosamine diphosphatase [Saprospiraceae bacterium]|nr:UDP-2,3-diacylglucosamine diphosphatase [Saprospiraceae bacterium]